MAISIDKVLALTATEWAEITAANLNSYTPVGVFDNGDSSFLHIEESVEGLAKKAPEGTVAIVNYTQRIVHGNSQEHWYSYGVALVIKDK
jgi:hypothetical protein